MIPSLFLPFDYVNGKTFSIKHSIDYFGKRKPLELYELDIDNRAYYTFRGLVELNTLLSIRLNVKTNTAALKKCCPPRIFYAFAVLRVAGIRGG